MENDENINEETTPVTPNGSDVEVNGGTIIDTTIDSTAKIEVPELLIDQIIGQDHAVEVVKKQQAKGDMS